MSIRNSARFKTATKILVIAAALLVLVAWSLGTPPGLDQKAAAIGYAVCHQIPERSFHVGAYQLPLCCRCSGMYLGAVTGLVFQSLTGWKRSRTPHWSLLAVLGVFVAAFIVDGGNSYLALIRQVQPGFLPWLPKLYEPGNAMRLLTGSGMGLGMAALLYPAFNQSVWADHDETRPSLTWKNFAPLVAVQLLLDLLVLTESPIALVPLAVVSALGVWLVLTVVYALVWVMVMGEENQHRRLASLWLAFLAGLTLAVLQTTAIDAVRFWLTGTWGAFPLAGS